MEKLGNKQLLHANKRKSLFVWQGSPRWKNTLKRRKWDKNRRGRKTKRQSLFNPVLAVSHSARRSDEHIFSVCVTLWNDCSSGFTAFSPLLYRGKTRHKSGKECVISKCYQLLLRTCICVITKPNMSDYSPLLASVPQRAPTQTWALPSGRLSTWWGGPQNRGTARWDQPSPADGQRGRARRRKSEVIDNLFTCCWVNIQCLLSLLPWPSQAANDGCNSVSWLIKALSSSK